MKRCRAGFRGLINDEFVDRSSRSCVVLYDFSCSTSLWYSILRQFCGARGSDLREFYKIASRAW